ncbi:BQ5605_C010g06182 [Microbotryum silenes-dioicae]|uniref:BQ5605_C010g06182 protein n=1 Tax=Microbotryum silenes-dioicae TaxID=796604 RepID=A0A2X0MBX6_9BASI|nr:BQ5605_C010g06182 [Microbotryum silenes-dioicae]
MPAGAIDVHPEKHHPQHAYDDGQPKTASGMEAQMQDQDRLAALGVNSELKRGWGLLENFGSSFSIISVVTGITTLFATGLASGGPAVMAFGWLFVSFFTMFVAASMAEIVSAVPTSGGPYHWSALLAPPKYSAFAAWCTGYFNLLGQVAVTTGISFGLAGVISTIAAMHGYVPSAAKTIGIYAGILVSHGIINTFGIWLLGFFNRASIVLQSAGVGGLAISVLAKAPRLRSGREIFLAFNDGTGLDGVGWGQRASNAYVACIGILLAQYTITGFDASAHMSEETHSAARTAPLGVITAVGASALWGLFYLMSLLASIQNLEDTIGNTVGNPVLKIFLDCFGDPGATIAFAFICVCIYLCGLFSITANSRMMYAFSRERALPGFFDHVESRSSSPVRAVWLAVVLAFCLALPSLGSAVAFSAATSIATIGLYISYVIPIGIRLFAHKRFLEIRGPWHLGATGRPVAAVALAYVGFITVVFCLPQLNPVDRETLNYTPVAVGIIGLYTILSWFLFARRWYKGPRLSEYLDDFLNSCSPSFDLYYCIPSLFSVALAEAALEPGLPVIAQLENEDDKDKVAKVGVERVITQ